MLDMVMTLFLDAYAHALYHESVNWTQAISEDEWKKLFQMSQEQNVLPMIYDAVFQCQSISALPSEMLHQLRMQVVRDVSIQTIKTAEFLKLYAFLADKGLHPIVMKGIVCRQLYPVPDNRPSSDEDLLIEENLYDQYHSAFLQADMVLANPKQNLNAFEIPYGRKGMPLYIELHKKPFPPDSDAYGDLNAYFKDVFQTSVDVPVEKVLVRTMDPDHAVLYLICHAFKHFLHSGVGIRQISDIALYTKQYHPDMNWILSQCKAFHADIFVLCLYKITVKYFGFQAEDFGLSSDKLESVQEESLLQDCLLGGVFGDSSLTRKHSSTITLNAVKAKKSNGKANLFRSVFPSGKDLVGRYTYLKDKPYLLPKAWLDRIKHYHRETKGNVSAAKEAVEIGNARVNLLKKYRIIQ